MMGFAFCDRCGVPIAAFGPSACERCRPEPVPKAKRIQVEKETRTR